MNAKALAAVAAAVLAGLAFWGRNLLRDLRPAFPTKTVEARSFRVRYPSHWDATDTTNPRFGDDDVLIENHGPGLDPSGHRLDEVRMRMHLGDEGAGFKSVKELVRKVQEGSGGSTRAESLILNNGIEAQVWKSEIPTVDVAGWKRWIAFKGPNGHCYLAGYDLPYRWKARARYNHLFETVLGSMEFKSNGAKR